jgi:hypothetical protein
MRSEEWSAKETLSGAQLPGLIFILYGAGM